MKKIVLLSLLLALWTTSASAVVPPKPTTSGFVFDYSNVIDAEVEAELNNFARALQQSGKLEVFFLTVGTIGDYEPYEYGMEIFRSWGIGDEKTNNGLLIYATTDMPPGDNTVRFSTGYGVEGNYTDGRTAELTETYMLPALAEGDYTTAFAQVAEAIREQEELAYDWENAEAFSHHDEIDGFTIMILIGVFLGFLFYIYRLIESFFRSIQRRRYEKHYQKTGEDIRSAGYMKYEERRLKRQAAAAAAAAASSDYDYDSSSYSGGSSDSGYSGGGGDSGGGGSDRNF